jgi:hypothetical protein
MKTKILLLLTIGLMMNTACMEDFLEEEAFSEFTEANYYIADEDFVNLVNGIYAPLDGMLLGFNHSNATASAVATTISASYEPFDVFNNAILPGNGTIDGLWSSMYSGITRANSALERMENFSFTNTALESRLIGETKFLRAYYYFNLVRWYGAVPLLEEPVTNFSSIDDVVAVSSIPRATLDALYGLIENDLSDAASKLSPISSLRGTPDLGRASREAAQALLGLVYLTTGEYGKAETELLKVENSSGLRLTDDYSCVSGSNTVESIFEIQFAGDNAMSRNGLNNQVPPEGSGQGNIAFEQPVGAIFAELQFFHSFASNDRRLKEFFITEYTLNGQTVPYWEFPQPAPHFAKYVKTVEYSDINYPLIRYADVLLMIAEAKLQNGKAVSEAEPYINLVRNRAGLDDITSGLTNEQFMDSLFLERKKELCLEGHEFFDSKRFGKLISDVEASAQYNQMLITNHPDTSLLALPRPSELDISTDNLLWPIPVETLDRNDQLQQNPGY